MFNFYLPAHSPAGQIADAGLVAPEFQIVTSNSIVGLSNLLDFAIVADYVTDAPEPFAPVRLTYADYRPIADDIPALLDRLDLVLTAGTMDSDTRAAIQRTLNDIDDLDFRTKIAVYLVMISADHTVRL